MNRISKLDRGSELIKHLMAIMVILASLLILPKASATVGETFTIGDLKYTVLTEEGSTGTVEVKKKNSVSADLTIPASVKNRDIIYSVTSIGNYAFEYSYLTNITIPDSVISIGNYAFYYCRNLTSITIPDSVISIGDWAFYDCERLTDITIPDYVTFIGSSAFVGCSSLTSVTIGNSLTSIGNSAFSGCRSLTSVIIGNGVTSIGNYAFSGCNSLMSITIPDSVTSIGDYAFDYCRNLTSIAIPDGMTSIGIDAFNECDQLPPILFSVGKKVLVQYSSSNTETSYAIPDTVTSIADYAFFGCSSLMSITIPDGVTSIGSSAFSGCSSLTNMTIGNGVTSIGNSAFLGCSRLNNITIPDTVNSIGEKAFQNCSWLTSIIIPDNVTFIGNRAFSECIGLRSVKIGNGVTSIGVEVFSSCDNLKNVTVGKRVTSIGEKAFSGCNNLTSITIPDSVTSIGIDAFNECDQLPPVLFSEGKKVLVRYSPFNTETFYAIPDTVTFIADYAFDDCNSLMSITIPDSVTSVECNTLYGCNNLQSINVDPNNAIYSSLDGVLFDKEQFMLVQYPFARDGEYTIPKSVVSIRYHAFAGCTGTTSLIIPEGVEAIEHNAFYRFKGLQKVQLPSTLKAIGEDAFFGCVNLQEINIPDSVTNIGAGAFANCKSLVQLDIPNYIKEIGDSAFYRCEKLKVIYIPDSCTEVGAYMFKHCNSLETAIIGAGIKEIQDGFFFGCGKVEDDYYKRNFSDPIALRYGNLKEVYFLGDNPGITANLFLIDNIRSLGTNSFYTTKGQQIDAPQLWVDPIQKKTPVLYCLGDRYGWYPLSYEEALDEVRNSSWGNLDSQENLGSTLNFCLNYEELTAVESDFEYNGGTILSYKGHSPVVVIPDFVIEIGKNAFANCTGVYAIIVPESVKMIGDHAFANCPHLKTVQFRGEAPTASENIFEGSHCVVYYESEISGWNTSWKGTDVSTIEKLTEGDFIYEINDLEVTITGYMGTSSYLEIPSEIKGYSVTRIKEKAFLGCGNLANVVIPNNVTEIGDYAFWNCRGLISVTIPDSMISIGDSAFYNCSSLTDITIPESITSITESTFSGCESLASIIIPDSVTEIGDCAFWNCKSLISITMPDSIISIGDSAFYNCISLTDITIPESITSIAGSTFSGCESLVSIIIPDSVTEVGRRVFYNCKSLKGIYFKGNAPIATWDSFNNTLAIIYCRAGTEGWTNPWFGCPTTVWIEAPEVMIQPMSQAVLEDDFVTFTVSAEGTLPLNYQWYKDNIAIEGAISETYTIESVTTEDLGNYQVVVTNTEGEAVSNIAVLSLLQPPTITVNPVSVTVDNGTNVVFTVEALNADSYQWYKDETAISGATETTYSIDYVKGYDVGTYTAMAINRAGAEKSSPAALSLTQPYRATAELQMVNGFIVGITVTDCGWGYEFEPKVRIKDESGEGAEAHCVVENGMVTAIILDNPGSGYSEETTVKVGSPFKYVGLKAEVKQVKLTLYLVLGETYQLEACTDLSTHDWKRIGEPFIADEEETEVVVEVMETGRYFRVHEVK